MGVAMILPSGLGCCGLLSPMSMASGFKWGIPLSGGGGGPVMTGVVCTFSSTSLSDPVQLNYNK